MSFRSSLTLAAVVCGALASCTVYPEDGPNGPKKKDRKDQATVSQPDQQDIQKKRDEMKKRDEEQAKKEAEQKLNDPAPEQKPDTMANTGGTPQETQPKPKPEKKDYPFANPVPGKDGFVFSPYNNKVVDVRDIPSGTLVQDPTYPQSEKKYFRVP
jgi:cell division protein FtsN